MLYHSIPPLFKIEREDRKDITKPIKVFMNDVLIEATDPYMKNFDGHEEWEATSLHSKQELLM